MNGKSMKLKAVIIALAAITSIFGMDTDVMDENQVDRSASYCDSSDNSCSCDSSMNDHNEKAFTSWSLKNFPHINSLKCDRFSEKSAAICDPDNILQEQDFHIIMEAINGLENVDIKCLNGDSSAQKFDIIHNGNSMDDKNDKNDEEGRSEGNVAPIEVAVVLVKKLDIRNGINEEVATQEFAMGLHNEWGIGSTFSSSCSEASTGILVLLSLYDRTIFISRGSALESILTNGRIDEIVGIMAPQFRQGLYGRGITHGLEHISYLLERGVTPYWQDFFSSISFEVVVMGMIVLFNLLSMWWQRRQDLEYANVRSQLSRIDRDHALSLQGQYRCMSCPICLEDFQGVNDENRQQQSPLTDGDDSALQNQTSGTCTFVPTIGSDGLPLKLLRCGHVFDETCWREYVSTRHGDIRVCPICKQDVAGTNNNESASSSTAISSTNQEHNNERNLLNETETETENEIQNQNTQLYQRERTFRLTRLQMRYPRFINQSTLQRWTDHSNNGSLARDREFMRRNPAEIRRVRAASSSRSVRGSGRVSFGGGTSSGGRGGKW